MIDMTITYASLAADREPPASALSSMKTLKLARLGRIVRLLKFKVGGGGHLQKKTWKLGGGNSNMFGIFTPKIGEDESILTRIFFRWVAITHQPEKDSKGKSSSKTASNS